MRTIQPKDEQERKEIEDLIEDFLRCQNEVDSTNLYWRLSGNKHCPQELRTAAYVMWQAQLRMRSAINKYATTVPYYLG